jgi:hypothetical protein
MIGIAVCHAAEQASPVVTCGAHLPQENCAAGKDVVRWVLWRSGGGVERWRWVLVAHDDWEELTRFYGVPSRVPGFTHLDTRTTYLDDVTYALDGRTAPEKFPDMGRLAGASRVEWLVTHELGHVICGVRDERSADMAANRLRLRTKDPCRGLLVHKLPARK